MNPTPQLFDKVKNKLLVSAIKYFIDIQEDEIEAQVYEDSKELEYYIDIVSNLQHVRTWYSNAEDLLSDYRAAKQIISELKKNSK